MFNIANRIRKCLSWRQIRKIIRKMSRVLILGFIIFLLHLFTERVFQFELPPFVVNFIQQPYLYKPEGEITLATYKPFLFSTLPNAVNGNAPPAIVPGSKNNSRKFVMSSNARKSYEQGFSYPLDIDLAKMVSDHITHGVKIPAKPINPHPFKYIHSPSKCEFNGSSQNPTLLILVKSATQNRVLRNGIRLSWGNITLPNVKIVFLLAEMAKKQASVDREMKEYGDIVEENFKEAYHNNTYKSIMGYNWAVSHCQTADFLFFVDDDYLVIVNNILSYIKNLDQKFIYNLFVGFLVPRSRPFTDITSKWYVSMEEYPYDVWPPYLAGGAYLVSKTVAQRFQLAFPFVKYLRIDDSYIGIVGKKLRIEPRGTVHVLQQKRTIMRHVPARFFAAHGFNDPSELSRKHRELQDIFKRFKAMQTTKRSMRV